MKLIILFGAAVMLTACGWQHQTPDHLPPPPNMSAPSGPPPPMPAPEDSGTSQ